MREELSAASSVTQRTSVEAAELQLRKLRDEMAALRLAHESELGTVRAQHAQELASQKRLAAMELESAEKAAQHGAQLAELAEQVQSAVGVVGRMQKQVDSERSQTWDQLQAYQQQRGAALLQQEARLQEAAQESSANPNPNPNPNPNSNPHPNPDQESSAERAKLATLGSTLQASVAELRSGQGEEKQRLADEHERLNRLQQQLERERAGMLAELAEERRRLDDLRENRLHELQKQVRVSYP